MERPISYVIVNHMHVLPCHVLLTLGANKFGIGGVTKRVHFKLDTDKNGITMNFSSRDVFDDEEIARKELFKRKLKEGK